MTTSSIEKLFLGLDESAILLQEKLELTYLESLIEVGDILFQQEVPHQFDDITTKRLKNHLLSINLQELTAEDIRKSYQLAILKGSKEAIQPNHSMTPDAVALFMSYLVNKVIGGRKDAAILDLALGSGNLLTAILNHSSHHLRSYGVEVDETLLRLAYVNSNLQQHKLELFHQDSLKPLYIDPVDVVVADLPIGYYPNDQVAKKYKLRADEGHSYSHYLMLEQALNYTTEGGYLLFIIPNHFFQGDQAPKLHSFIKEKAVILALLQLPLSMFKNEAQGKSIFLLQKKSNNVKAPSQALLAELPSFSKQSALSDMVTQIDQWFKKELGI
ncbi:class I SAM-dependent methyltransferase [Anaerobacillus sp. MEB173]|uniref:class I SAM-dependent methyltransferase n=1 Tax=Anaerobacillus sp. MEB173 TaxID=3383345 RepID=UPI003F92A55A